MMDIKNPETLLTILCIFHVLTVLGLTLFYHFKLKAEREAKMAFRQLSIDWENKIHDMLTETGAYDMVHLKQMVEEEVEYFKQTNKTQTLN